MKTFCLVWLLIFLAVSHLVVPLKDHTGWWVFTSWSLFASAEEISFDLELQSEDHHFYLSDRWTSNINPHLRMNKLVYYKNLNNLIKFDTHFLDLKDQHVNEFAQELKKINIELLRVCKVRVYLEDYILMSHQQKGENCETIH